MVDGPSVEVRLERLGVLLGEMDEIRDGGRAVYDSDMRIRLAAERAMQLAIQVCIDIAGHLVSERDLPVPEDYGGLFIALVQRGLDRDLAERLVAATGLRNILVHDYLKIDDDVVWRSLGHLDDLREFAAFVVRFLD